MQRMRFFLVALMGLVTAWGRCHAFLMGHENSRQSTTVQRALAPRNERWFDGDAAEELNNRRSLLQSMLIAMVLTRSTAPAFAGGLVQFPPTKPFLNKYHFMRVGETLLEAEDIWSTNPLFLTNREDALSPKGQEQVIAACKELKAANMAPTVLKYSLAAACIDTANLVGRELGIGRDRLVPEFTFQDPRAIGGWDMLSKTEITPAVWAMDDLEAGTMGLGARPPPNEDGTPHETIADQTIRLRQLMSVLESQYSGDTILLIFPDGTGPAVLSAMFAGIPYNRVHELEYAPGELRTNITPESVRSLWKAKLADPIAQEEYQRILAEGKVKLEELRSTESFVNRKDQRLERERMEMEALYEQKRQQERKLEQEKQLAREEMRMQQAQARQRQQEEKQKQQQQSRSSSSSELASANTDSDNGPVAAFGSAAVIAVAGVTFMGGKDEGTPTLTKVASTNATQAKDEESEENVAAPTEPVKNGVESPNTNNATTAEALPSYFGASSSSSSSVSSERNEDVLVSPQQNSTATVVVKQRINGSSQSTFVEPVLDPREAARKAMQDYLDQDDGGSAWLMSLSEIMDEADEVEADEVMEDD